MKDCSRVAFAFVSSVVLAVSLSACGPKTMVVTLPPKIDLQPYDTIGVIDFASDPAGKLDQIATQKFMAVVQASQPNVRFLELGPAGQVLQSTGRERIDPEAVRALGARYKVDTIFTGAYEISSLKPQVKFGEDFSSVSASARVKITLMVKHLDTKTGATLWTNSRWGEWPVASLHKGAGQGVSFGVSTPEDKYAVFMEQLVNAVTHDFRVRYETRAVAEK